VPDPEPIADQAAPPIMTFLSDLTLVAEALDRHLARARARATPVLAQRPMASIIEDLQLDRFARHGGLEGDALRGFMARYLETIINLHHPGYLGHQVAVPHHAAALGALIDGLTNNPMAIYEMGPGAAAIEYFVVNWMLEKVGWTPTPLETERQAEGTFGGGVLTHGGSLANLTALIAARSAVRPNAWRQGNPGDLAVMVSGTHRFAASAPMAQSRSGRSRSTGRRVQMRRSSAATSRRASSRHLRPTRPPTRSLRCPPASTVTNRTGAVCSRPRTIAPSANRSRNTPSCAARAGALASWRGAITTPSWEETSRVFFRD
jgi:hypothetical protein